MIIKRQKAQKNVSQKEKLNFKIINCVKACQTLNPINYLERKEIDVDCLKEDEKEFIKNKSTLKTQQRFKSEKHTFCFYSRN